mmetsp:Transcript_89258/g.257420  ORF Transcript_89258/g.257420 Transcript_89258/m.257420 type:complete len:279 (+) Transcript_89258:1736-2572(+)
MYRGLTQPCNPSTNAREFDATLRQTCSAEFETAKCRMAAGNRGIKCTESSSILRTQSTPSSPPLNSSGPECVSVRTGYACQCHLPGTIGLLAWPTRSSAAPHQSQTTPLMSPVAMYRPAGSTESAVISWRCQCLRLWPQPWRNTTRSHPSPTAAISPAASKGPAFMTDIGSNPAFLAASTRATSTRSTSAPSPATPRRTRSVPRAGQRNASTGALSVTWAKQAAVLESQRVTSSAAPMARGSPQTPDVVGACAGPAATAATRPVPGDSAPSCFPVRTL